MIPLKDNFEFAHHYPVILNSFHYNDPFGVV
jgi:hypothetical protein